MNDILIAAISCTGMFGAFVVVIALPRWMFRGMVRSKLWEIRDRAWDAARAGDIPQLMADRIVDFAESLIAAVTLLPGYTFRKDMAKIGALMEERDADDEASSSNDADIEQLQRCGLPALQTMLELNLLVMRYAFLSAILGSWTGLIVGPVRHRRHLQMIREDLEELCKPRSPNSRPSDTRLELKFVLRAATATSGALSGSRVSSERLISIGSS